MMLGARPDFRRSGGRLPPFVSAAEVVAEVLPGLRPVERIGVEEAATRYRKTRVGMQWQAWDPAAAPYMSEPQTVVTSRRFLALAFIGPSQSLKTSALIENPVAHAMTCAPKIVHVVQMNEVAAGAFSVEKIGPMVANSPALEARKLPGRASESMYSRAYLGGMRLTIGWPTAASLSSRAIPLVLLTDYDRMPDNIDGEGPAWVLARARNTSFKSLGMTVAETSPGRDVTAARFEATSIHEAPPCGGLLGIYNDGSRGRWYWRCTGCGEEFEPRLDRMHWADNLSPTDAAAGAVMICPPCGTVIEAAQKSVMNAGGRWLHESEDGAEAVPLGDPRMRKTDVATYWLHGVAAALSSWPVMLAQYIAARRAYDDDGDATTLRAVMNTGLGMPFLRPTRKGEKRATAAALLAAASDLPLGIAPAWALVLLASVDVQGGAASRFVVNVEAWGDEGRRCLVDRYDIAAPPPGAPDMPRDRIDPATYAEDWAALDAVKAKAYPVAGADYALRPAAVVVDSGGEAGVTDNAYRFWRDKRSAGEGRLWYLARPLGGPQMAMAWVQTPKRGSKGKAAAVDVPLLYIATDRAKDAVSAALARPADAVGSYLVPRDAPPEVFRELTAEEPTPKGWRLRAGERRNEALDLACYALGLATVFHADRLNRAAAPRWALPGAGNENAVRIDADAARPSVAVPPAPSGPPMPAPAPPAPPAPLAPRGRRIRGRSKFING
jgi:phage terminase large subunit GpA-like protein